MTAPKWILFGAALAMMAASAMLLQRALGGRGLSEPGVKISRAPIFDEKGRQISAQSVVLPERVPGLDGIKIPISEIEASGLPADTTFGRCGYARDGFQTQATVVLMGADRASIHRPQWCLVGAGWNIDRTERAQVPMARPYHYKLPVNKLVTSRKEAGGRIAGVYVYWYVSKDKITSEQLGRLWSTTWTALTTGVRERWAYISYFAPCLPGQEEATFQRLEKVIQDSVPEFQLASGPRDPEPLPMAAQN